MRKLISLLLALVMVMSFATVAFADDVTDASTVTLTKSYKATNGGVSPAETFTFSAFTQVSIEENEAAEWPETLPSITEITYAEGAATADGEGTGTATATITLPTYTAVGVYTYSFNEITPETKTAGVTYNSTTMYLVVTVIEQNGKVRVGAVHCEGEPGTGTKTSVFENSYESGTLAVSKTVTGNLGDKTKYFDVTVTFAAAEGEVINSTIKYSGGQYTEDVVVENNTATIQVKDGDTVTFTNIPEGVTWAVSEANYTEEGYDAPVYSAENGTMTAGGEDTSAITNNKTADVDTGIELDSVPFVVMMIVCAAAAVLFVIKRRSVEF